MNQKQPLRRLLSLLLLTASMLSALPLSAVEFTVGSLTYTSDDDSTASVSRCDRNASGELIIPESVEYSGCTYSVTSIGDEAFSGCSDLTSLTIPGSITNIGECAFDSCQSIRQIVICDGETTLSLRNGSFLYSGGPEWEVIKDKFYNSIFHDCPIETLYIGRDIETSNRSTYIIINGLFESQDELKNITFGENVTSLESSIFKNCSGLTSITIPNSVTSIGERAFAGCSSLTSVSIPNSVTNIGDAAFADCSNLTNIHVESGNTNYCSLDGVLFNSNKSMLVAFPGSRSGEYEIPSSVTSISSYAFSGCINLTSLTIPLSVSNIGECAFDHCQSIRQLVICDGKSPLRLARGKYRGSEEDYYSRYDAYNSIFHDCPIETLYIGRNITTVEYDYSKRVDGPFQGKGALSGVTFGEKVTSIEKSMFRGCSGLTSVTIPNSVTSIGDNAFRGCN